MINQIHLGDSIDIMKNISDNSIDLTLTSPPYDTLRTYNNTISSDIIFDNHFSFPFVDIAKELWRVTKDGGIVVWVVNDQIINGGESGNSFRQALKFQEIGFKIYDTMIYHKNGAPFPETGRYSQVFEYMFVLLKGDKPNTVNIIKDKENRWAGSKTFGTPSARKADGTLKKKGGFTISKYGSRYNVWYILNGKGFGGDKLSHLHPACVDIDTECLTKNGWKKYNEIKINDEVLSYNLLNDILEWDTIKNLHISEYDGDIYEVNGRRLSLMITPNHRNVVELNGKISIKETTLLKNRHNILTSCPVNSNTKVIDENFAYLIGIILTDGYISNGIHITQDYMYNKIAYNKIINALNLLEVNYSISKRRRYYTYTGSKTIENKISINENDIDNCDYYQVSYCSDINIMDSDFIEEVIKYIPDKKVTNIIYDLDNKSLNKIIEGIIDGDGTTRSEKNNSFIICGKNEEFHSNLQIVAFLAGYTADCITTSKNKIYTQLKKDRYKNLRNSKNSILEKNKFTDIVWCPEVEKNGTWVARRNGKIFITGNSFPESLAEDHILSWSNEGDIVLDPMCGIGTTLKMAKMNNRNFIGIDINQEYCEISNKRISNIIPYSKESVNPKSKFILTREEALAKRKENRKNKNLLKSG